MVIKNRKLPITPHIYVDWTSMLEKRNPVFNRVIAKAHRLGIYDILGMWQDWNCELVAQFCATAWLSGNGYDNTINFSIEGHHFSLCIKEIPALFILANDDFHRVDISNERTVSSNEFTPLYLLGNESNYGAIHGLLPEYAIFNKIFRGTLMAKRADWSNINGSTRVLLLALLDGHPLPCISVFFWIEMLYMLKHGSSYVIYALYIQKIINTKIDMEFQYDGDHGPYHPQPIRTPHTSPPAVATPVGARVPPASGHAPSSTLESSRAATRQGKKQNILLKGLKTLISMCRSNDTLIRESHQQMSQRLSHLEERQREINTSMGLENPEPTVYPPPSVEVPWAWYRNAAADDDGDGIDKADDEESE
jgi:hypothetical protein